MNDFDFFKKEHKEQNEKLSFVHTSFEDHREEIDKIRNGTYINPLPIGINGFEAHFNMFYGMLLGITGYPQSGKSELVNFIACNHVASQRGKACLFSPESDTAILKTEISNTLKHILMESVDVSDNIVHEYFTFLEIKDNEGLPDIKNMIEDFEEMSIDGYNFFNIDPMNWVTSNLYTSQGSFESLRLTLTYLKQFAKRSKSIMSYVEHPKTPTPNRDGVIPMCNVFSMNGGTMHNNKCDAILINHRQRQIDENGKAKSSSNDPVLLEVAKLKFQKYLGYPDNVMLHFDQKTGIYQRWKEDYGNQINGF